MEFWKFTLQSKKIHFALKLFYSPWPSFLFELFFRTNIFGQNSICPKRRRKAFFVASMFQFFFSVFPSTECPLRTDENDDAEKVDFFKNKRTPPNFFHLLKNIEGEILLKKAWTCALSFFSYVLNQNYLIWKWLSCKQNFLYNFFY